MGDKMDCVYLVTTGDGSDGNEWQVESIHKTEDGAKRAKFAYDHKVYTRPDGSTYTFTANEVEVWLLQD